jgi:hypothetical protein
MKTAVRRPEGSGHSVSLNRVPWVLAEEMRELSH